VVRCCLLLWRVVLDDGACEEVAGSCVCRAFLVRLLSGILLISIHNIREEWRVSYKQEARATESGEESLRPLHCWRLREWRERIEQLIALSVLFLLHREQRNPLGYLPERITSSLLASLRAVVVFKDGETVSSSPSRSDADASSVFCLGEKIMVFAPLLQLATVFVCFRYKILVEKLYKVAGLSVTMPWPRLQGLCSKYQCRLRCHEVV